MYLVSRILFPPMMIAYGHMLGGLGLPGGPLAVCILAPVGAFLIGSVRC